MNELTLSRKELPDTLEDLAKFIVVGQEKLAAVRAQIRAIDRLGLAKEVHDQLDAEARDLGEAVIDAKVRLGELTAQMEKADADRGNQYTGGKSTPLSNSQSKTERLAELGIPLHTAERCERMARHPEIVAQAKERARKDGRIITQRDVLNCIATPSKPKMSYQNIVAEAEREHEEFKSKKVVGLKEAKRDSQNQEILRRDTRVKLSKIYMAVYDAFSVGLPLITEAAMADKAEIMQGLSWSRDMIEAMMDAIHKGDK